MRHIFGPVPSRRLGRSLGIDVIPAKTCSFDCIYCESGKTTHLTLKREQFVEPNEVLQELEEFFRVFPNGTDVLTFSSAGEPTLYLGIGELIRAIRKSYPQLPLIVLTNGSLLWDPEVRKDLLEAVRVVPSLDAVTPEVFRKINRPHPSLDVSKIVEGLRAFRAEYSGQLHLEIVLASGVNDSPEELSRLAEIAQTIEPDKIELNTVVRPPALGGTEGLSTERMEWAATFFPEGRTEVVGVFNGQKRDSSGEDLETRILQTIERRPCTVPELAASLGIAGSRLEEESQRLARENKLIINSFNGKQFLCPIKS